MNKKIIVVLIVLLFLTCGGVSAFDLFGGQHYEDIEVSEVDTGVTNFSFVNSNGNTFDNYVYSVFYMLKNVPESSKGGKLVTYLYDGNGKIVSESSTGFNSSSYKINDTTFSNGYIVGTGQFSLNNLTNVSYYVIELVKDDKVVFNTTGSFNMSNYEDHEFSDEHSSSDVSSNSSDSNNGINYVASSNSNKFHSQYCSQAHKINDANKITFSSRDEAINAGYEPCGICHP